MIILSRPLVWIINNLIHLHGETKFASRSQPIWLDHNLSSSCLYDLLDNSEAKSNAITVEGCGPLELAEASEQLGEILDSNSSSRVLHTHFDKLVLININRVRSFYLDWALLCKFHSVFDQVDNNLLKPLPIANQFWKGLIEGCGVGKEESNSLEPNLRLKGITDQVKSFIGIEFRLAETKYSVFDLSQVK